MGAHDFTCSAYGKTANDAFQAARDHAAWEHGHGGYTGTIAEKHDFTLFAIPPRVKVNDLLKLMHDYYWLSSDVEHARYVVRECEQWGKGARKTLHGKTLKQAQAALKSAEVKLARFKARVDKRKLGDLVVKGAEIAHGDKWGPALALGPVSGSEETKMRTHAQGVTARHTPDGWKYSKPRGQSLFVFTGMASS